MSNYNVITDWDGKDALADSSPDKIISGDEFQDEFDAIATAVATKADINGNASESFIASTAVSGTNTTQVATTAFVGTAITNAAGTGLTYNSGALDISSTSNGYGTRTVSTSAPSGGSNGDIWYKVSS